MIDTLTKEIADIAQISGFGLPIGDEDTALVDFGFGSIDRKKPVILFIGHYPAVSISTLDYIEEHGLEDEIEVSGICCTALESSRYRKYVKVAGPLSMQLFFIRSGIADVIVLDEQCVRTDVIEQAKRTGAPVILTTDKICYNMPDATDRDADEIVDELVNGVEGVLIADPSKAAEVITKTAIKMKPKREFIQHLPTKEEVVETAELCTECGWCDRACPNSLPIREAVIAAKQNDLDKLCDLYYSCMSCGRCESECERDLKLVDMIQTAANDIIMGESYTIRSGRGPILDTEIRTVGAPIVLGEIPGVVALVGCTNLPKGWHDVVK
jgi:acetyl-CoA decarbonylase/synthase complex subunit alpha